MSIVPAGDPAPSAGLAFLAFLEERGVVTITGIDTQKFAELGVSYAEFEGLLGMFGKLHRTSAWLIGDALNHGERAYPQEYVQAAEATGLAEQTLMNYKSVCKAVPRSRRKPNLPFSVHAEVMKLSPAEQKQWLDRADKEQWPRGRLREELRGPVIPLALREADVTDLARHVVRAARESGENYLVPAIAMRPLIAALGEE